MSTCIIVIGCYRCGTSAIAGMLHKSGVVMGHEFDPPNLNNPHGYWEDLEFKKLHKSMIDGTNCDKLYKKIICDRRDRYNFWGIKDPRLCSLLPILVDVLDNHSVNHKIIECVRDTKDITKSLVKSVGGHIDWLPRVENHIAEKEKNLLNYKGKKLTICFDDIFKEDTPDKISEFCDQKSFCL